nr:hypothetical protein [Cytophagales bacterium]
MFPFCLKSAFTLVITFCCYVTISPSLIAQQNEQIPTYNIQYENSPETLRAWSDRAPHAINLIRFHEMDILGPNEGIYNQSEYGSSEFTFPSIGSDVEKGDGKHVCKPVFYDPEKFELIEQSAFNISSPTLKNKAKTERICTWGKFKGKEGNEFYVFNIHFGEIESVQPRESKKMILEKINAINKEHLPCILTGDFNLSETSPSTEDTINQEDDDEEERAGTLISTES